MLGIVACKRCSQCGEYKPFSQFNKSSHGKYGLYSKCKQCKNINAKTYRIENPDKIRSKNKAYRSAHIDKEHSYKLNYNTEHAEHRRLYDREWRSKNTEKVVAKGHTYRAKLRNSGGRFTSSEWIELKEKYNFTCLRCRQREPEIKLTADHVIPISSGGSNSIDNIQPLCISCNCSKGNRSSKDYRFVI